MSQAARQIITVTGQSGQSKVGASVARFVLEDAIELN
jgi:hypothetical protein